MSKVFRTAAVVAAATCALLLAACGGTTVVTSGEGGQQMNTITVNATAEVKVVPDRASIQVGVTTQGATADEAEAANAQLMDAVLAALSEQGVAEDSVQTAWTNLSPLYGFAEDPAAYSEEPVADDEAFVETTGAYTEVWNVGGNDIVGYGPTVTIHFAYQDPAHVEGLESKGSSIRQCYTIDGRRISHPRKGLNVVRTADGRVHKFIR